MLTTYKWSVDQYHQAIAAGLFEESQVELLRGEIVVMPPEGEPHAYYNSETGDYLRTLLGHRAKIREAHPITLPNDSEPIPDLAIVKPLGSVYLQHHPYPEDIFWLIEFSNTTLSKDLNEKKTIYAEAGIPEYWVVNLNQKEIHLCRDLHNGQYLMDTTYQSGTISPLAFADIKIKVSKLMGP